MARYIGLDVSLKDTFIAIREGGRRIWRGSRLIPQALTEIICKRAPAVSRIVFETWAKCRVKPVHRSTCDSTSVIRVAGNLP